MSKVSIPPSQVTTRFNLNLNYEQLVMVRDGVLALNPDSSKAIKERDNVVSLIERKLYEFERKVVKNVRNVSLGAGFKP